MNRVQHDVHTWSMTRSMTPPPPAVAGIGFARLRHCVRLGGRMLKTVPLGVTKRQPLHVAGALVWLSVAVVVGIFSPADLWVPLAAPWVVATGLMGVFIALPGRYWYMSKHATLEVVVTKDGWKVGNHMAARRGASQGRELRNQIRPVLTTFANAHGITVRTKAVNEDMAKRYIEEFEMKRTMEPGGLQLVREPQRGAPSPSQH